MTWLKIKPATESDTRASIFAGVFFGFIYFWGIFWEVRIAWKLNFEESAQCFELICIEKLD